MFCDLDCDIFEHLPNAPIHVLDLPLQHIVAHESLIFELLLILVLALAVGESYLRLNVSRGLGMFQGLDEVKVLSLFEFPEPSKLLLEGTVVVPPHKEVELIHADVVLLFLDDPMSLSILLHAPFAERFLTSGQDHDLPVFQFVPQLPLNITDEVTVLITH